MPAGKSKAPRAATKGAAAKGKTKPPARIGPRPISLHVAAASTTLLSSLAALPSARIGSLPWHPSLAAEAKALTADLLTADPTALAQAVGAEVNDRLAALIRGITKYQNHPYRRRLRAPPALWREGSTRLLDYGARKAEGGRTVLFVPSLVNRYYVLDLMRDVSLLRWLAKRGWRPLVVDWSDPGPAERRFTLSDYIASRLSNALAVAAAEGPVPVVGYCMGGDLALALALLQPDKVGALALLATPWDFHAELAEGARIFADAASGWQSLLDALGEMPVDLLQTFFAMLDPNLAINKFVAFANMDPDDPATTHFVALEDWLNDGVPLAAPVAAECLIGWYGENRPAGLAWRVAGEVVDPRLLKMPTLIAIPRGDRIVPPGSARALASAIEGATVIEPAAGHIGMMVGRKAPSALWRPLLDWLDQFAAPAP